MLLDNIIHFPEFKCSLFAYRSYVNIFDPGVSSELHTHILKYLTSSFSNFTDLSQSPSLRLDCFHYQPMLPISLLTLREW